LKNLSNLLTGILAGYTSFYGITANANTGDDMISPQDMVSDPSFGQIPIDATVTAPDYILRLPDREASGLFASHRSHRSHSSHRSHYSSASSSRGSSGSGSGVAIVAVAVGAAYYLGRKNKK